MDYLSRLNYPEIKTRISPLITRTKADLKETTGFYGGNARQGWALGSEIAKKQKLNPATALAVKIYKALSKTKIRGKDIAPLLSATVFSFTPIIGTGLIGFALGKAAHPKIVKSLNIIKNLFLKIKLK